MQKSSKNHLNGRVSILAGNLANRLGKTATIVGLLSAFALQACSPVPRHELSSEEKVADMEWIYSQFGHDYAPLSYKERRYGFKFEDLKAKYLVDAQATKSNEEFYALMFKFVAEFHDAHTSASLTNSALPGRANVAYLGFAGKRSGDGLVVTDLLPTMKQFAGDFPIHVGDKITQLDGVPLKDIVVNTFEKIRNLGNEESNQTYHMNKIFNRLSLNTPMPTAQYATLTVANQGNDGKDTKSVKLPWVIKDLQEFSKEQTDAIKAATPPKAPSQSDARLAQIFSLGMMTFTNDLNLVPQTVRNTMRIAPDFNYLKTFSFIETNPTWNDKSLADAVSEVSRKLGMKSAEPDLSPMQQLATERVVPASALPIPSAETYPMYITREKIRDSKGKETGDSKLVAYMHLDTFAPAAEESVVLSEISKDLQTLQDYGVKDLVIDMINNGGGSLSLGMQIAKMLSPDQIVLPDMQFRASDTWMDEFDAASRKGADGERAIAGGMLKELEKAQAEGRRLTHRVSAETLLDWPFNKQTNLKDRLNIVLLTNEMCASMCDIFTAILKDNQMATVVGAKTMGAGGNVVQHFQAPNSHLIVNQTESLMVRKTKDSQDATGQEPQDTDYIENNGIEPDVAMPVNEYSVSKYEPVRLKALQLLTTVPAQGGTQMSIKPGLNWSSMNIFGN